LGKELGGEGCLFEERIKTRWKGLYPPGKEGMKSRKSGGSKIKDGLKQNNKKGFT